MTALYNEIDPGAAAWLRELIARDLIAPGVVIEASIEDLTPNDLRGFTQCHFFAGIGVWSHALRRAGWRDDRPVWTASCPCQPFSSAGKGDGFDDERHLWPAVFHLATVCRPSDILGEQVASKDGLGWLDLVSTDMERADYAFAAVDMCAAGVEIPHVRQRLYWMAHSNDARPQRHGRPVQEYVPQGRKDADGQAALCAMEAPVRRWEAERGADGRIRYARSDLSAGAYGPASRMVRLRGYGNALSADTATAFIDSAMRVIAA